MQNSSLKIIETLIISILLIGGAFYSTEEYRSVSILMFGFVATLMTIISLKNIVIIKKIMVNKIQASIFVSMICFMILSSIWNKAIDLGIGALIIFIAWLYLTKVVRYKEYDSRPIFHSIWIAFLLISLLNLMHPFDFPFKGLFYNPNSLGGFYAAMVAGFCAMILNRLEQRKSITLYAIVLFISLALTLISNSRAAFTSSIISVLILIVLMLSARPGNKSNKKNGSKIVLFISLSLGLIILYWSVIYSIFIEKFLVKAGRGDITDSRLNTWMEILEGASILGAGREVFHNMEHAAHSTYFSILAQYGFLTAILFACLIVVTIFLSIKKINTNYYGVSPLFFVTSFSILSLTEGMLMKTSMFLFIFSLNLSIRKI